MVIQDTHSEAIHLDSVTDYSVETVSKTGLRRFAEMKGWSTMVFFSLENQPEAANG